MKSTYDKLHASYFNVLKRTSPNAYALYEELGNGDVKVGYNVFVNEIHTYKDKVCNIYYEISNNKDMSFIQFNRYISRDNKKWFKRPEYVNNIVWSKIFNVDTLQSYKAYYQLKAIINTYELYKILYKDTKIGKR